MTRGGLFLAIDINTFNTLTFLTDSDLLLLKVYISTLFFNFLVKAAALFDSSRKCSLPESRALNSDRPVPYFSGGGQLSRTSDTVGYEPRALAI